ncbi:c-type cytochrome [Ralstonia pseudosolanacearum]|uniref:C-type cytochrome n=1 Tax=Ralstonia solanacearum TaxID=305 RepID=A0AA92EH00_RALSL|nr:cytochrome c [Ralstonia pseudosolanacearum]QCX51894.1 c-type cytochrome [Ralstonia pseudosolanacearum]
MLKTGSTVQCIRWYQRFIWIGIAINLVFAIPALFWPDFLNATFGLPMQATYPWLQNAGMLLVGISLFYAPAGINALKYPVYAWLCVLSRLIAVVFWIYLINTSGYPEAFRPLMYSDGAMFLILGGLLYGGMPPDQRPWALISAGLDSLWQCVRTCLTGTRRKVLLAIALVVAFVGAETWVNLFREVPQPPLQSNVDHFKYAPIGLGPDARIPLYVFNVLPQACAQHMPKQNLGWQSFGFVYEGGRDLPIGLAKRQIGYPSVEANCALCHTGQYRKSADDVPVPVPTAPAALLNLESFQWFLYDCAGEPDFPSRVMREIDRHYSLGIIERLFYRFAIVPATQKAFLQQKQQYAWQKLRPEQGPGRTDTFNPTKMVVFDFPDDSTVGTVDLPQIWNQKPRESMYLHWDGNNNNIHERNYAAAMAVGATPQSVLPAEFKRVTDWLLDHQPPKWPFGELDQARVHRGESLWQAQCANCHAFGKAATGQVTVGLDQLGTDPYRLNSFTVGLVSKFHQFKSPPFDFGAYRKTQSYSNTPTDGVWLRAPYLHNGSVPTLWDLLQKPEHRPKVFYRGSSVFDQKQVGFVTAGPETKGGGTFKFDTSLPGNHNTGHAYGTDLTDSEKWDLIEYMKTL